VRGESSLTDGVSPVVGVMLMLAVTVMIAAIVSTYAGGITGGAEKSPQSSIRAAANTDLHRIYFAHNGGDPFTLRSVSVVLRSGDNKTSLSAFDAGSSRLRAFEEVGSSPGDSDTTIKAGDTFFLEGTDFNHGSGIQFGSMILTNTSKTSWLIVDHDTSKTISMGEFFL
jgi:archaeal type IV pilus assembly protein PilA